LNRRFALLPTEGDWRPARAVSGKACFWTVELFAGNEALFRGLHCHGKWDWETKYPVIRISFGAGISSGGANEFAMRICELLKQNARRLGVTLGNGSIPGQFTQLILEAEASFGQRAVVLVEGQTGSCRDGNRRFNVMTACFKDSIWKAPAN
jgi:hypothetical protein